MQIDHVQQHGCLERDEPVKDPGVVGKTAEAAGFGSAWVWSGRWFRGNAGFGSAAVWRLWLLAHEQAAVPAGWSNRRRAGFGSCRDTAMRARWTNRRRARFRSCGDTAMRARWANWRRTRFGG